MSGGEVKGFGSSGRERVCHPSTFCITICPKASGRGMIDNHLEFRALLEGPLHMHTEEQLEVSMRRLEGGSIGVGARRAAFRSSPR